MRWLLNAKTYLAISLLALSLISTANAGIIYVDPNATGTDDGSSWANAYNYLQDALYHAESASKPVDVWVAQGIYTPDSNSADPNGSGDRRATFGLVTGVAIYGGFVGGETFLYQHDPVRNETVLSGNIGSEQITDNCYRVVTSLGTDSTAVLDGFTITGGRTATPSIDGAGIYNNSGSPTIVDCIFVDNSAPHGGGRGGGMYSREGNPTLFNCTFRDNYAGFGGGAFVYSGAPTLTNCVFLRNSAPKSNFGRGGGVYNAYYGNPTLLNCIFSGNSAYNTGGGFFDNAVSPNRATLVNCTFSENSAVRNGGGGIVNNGDGVRLVNSILWGNRHQSGINEAAQFMYKGATINNCCIQAWSGSLGGRNNIGDDPRFVDANGIDNIPGTMDDNLHLLRESPCLNAGDNSALPPTLDTDIDGYPRIMQSTVDMGAYEFRPSDMPVIGLSWRDFDFIALVDGPNPQEQILGIQNIGDAVLNWTIMEECEWLRVDPCVGGSSGQTDQVALYIDTTSLDVGQYSCVLTVFDSNAINSPQCAMVDLRVGSPIIAVMPSTLGFSCPVGGPNPATQKLSIWNADLGTLKWQIAADCNWLDASPASGRSSGDVNEVVVTVYADDLDAGDYSCQVLISDLNAVNSPLLVTVNFHVGTPLIELGQTPVRFEYRPGDPNPAPKEFYIRNSDVAVLNWQIVEDCNWLDASPSAGQSTGENDYVRVTVDPNGLLPGNHLYNLTVVDPNARNSPQYATVSLYVDGPVINVVPETLYFIYSPDVPEPNAQTLAISNASIQTLQWSITEDCEWLNVWPLSGTSRGEANDVVVAVDWDKITGDHACTLTISDPNSVNKSKHVTVVVHHTEMPVLRVPSIFPTIQAAIDHAEDGDTVIVEPGRYTGLGNCNITFRGKAITVRSTDPNDFDVVAATVIDCNGEGRGFSFTSGEDANSILSGLTITNGSVYHHSFYYGGAITCRDTSPVISNCIIVGNTGPGGGIGTRGGQLVVKNCIITRNSSSSYGGGIYGSGQRSLTIENCIITNNVAAQRGGGIRTTSSYPVVITDSIITGNISSVAGGGISSGGPDIVITGCVITGNVATEHGGGICGRQYARLIISNSIVWGNSAPSGPEIALLETHPPIPEYNIYPALAPSYSNIRGGQTALYREEGYPLEWGPGNIDTDPCFADAGYWGHIDDPNIHIEPNDPNASWVDGDYHLKSQVGRWHASSQSWTRDDVTSLCIDAGDPNSDWTAELWPNGWRINLGAYGGAGQASMSPNDVGDVADLDFDDFVYRTDIPFFVEQWLIERFFLPADINRDGIVDFPDFAIFAQNWERPPVPYPADNPSPFDGAAAVSPTTRLSWTSDPNSRWHDVYLGTEYPGEFQRRQSTTTFDPNTLENDTWYFWRVDDMNPAGTTTGPVWGFKTGSPASSPDPYNGATGISTTPVLKWQAGIGAIWHDVYFGTSSPGTFQGNQVETTFNPGSLSKSTTYYWRIDEVTLEGTTTGSVWSFTTGSGGGR